MKNIEDISQELIDLVADMGDFWDALESIEQKYSLSRQQTKDIKNIFDNQ